MHLGIVFSEALKKAKISNYKIAMYCNVHPKTIETWKRTQPPIEMWRKIAELCNDPSLIDIACKHQCSTGNDFKHTPLNNINTHPSAILGKYKEERTELEPVFNKANKVLLNLIEGDTPTEFQEKIATEFLEGLIDKYGVIEVYKLWYKKTFGLKKFIEIQEEHFNKCIERGYIKKETKDE